MGNDATNKEPSFEDQVAAFKGFTAVDGEVRAEKPEELDMQARLAAANRTATAKKDDSAAEDEREDEEDGGEEGGEADTETEQEREAAEQAKKAGDSAKKSSKAPQERINQAIGRQRAAERARDAAMAEVAAINQRMAALEAAVRTGQQPALTPKPTNVNSAGAPNPNSYEFGELDSRYISDLARHEAREQIRAEQEQQNAQRATESQRAAAAHFTEAKRAFESAGLAKYPDFSEVVIETANRTEWPLSPVIAELMLGSDNGPDIAYFLATNVAEANRVAKLSPAQQAAWYGQQEALLSPKSTGATQEAPAPKTTKAPPLPGARARGTGNRTHVTADTTDFAAFESMVNAGQK